MCTSYYLKENSRSLRSVVNGVKIASESYVRVTCNGAVSVNMAHYVAYRNVSVSQMLRRKADPNYSDKLCDPFRLTVSQISRMRINGKRITVRSDGSDTGFLAGIKNICRAFP